MQYSDGMLPVTVTAVDIDSSGNDLTAATAWNQDGGSFTPGLPSGLVLSAVSSSGAAMPGEAAWTLSGTANLAAGTYIVQVTVGDGDNSTVVKITLIVEAEEAMVSFQGGNVTAVAVDSAGSDSSQSFQLTVNTRERYPDNGSDPLPGDISLAVVDVQLVPIGRGGAVSPLSCTQEVHNVGYDAQLTTTCDFDDVLFNTYTIQVTINGGYYEGAGEDVLTVYDPSLGFSYGGDWFY